MATINTILTMKNQIENQTKEVETTKINEGDWEAYKGVAIVKQGDKYIIAMAKSRISKEMFNSRIEAEKYVRNNQCEMAINATLAILNDVYQLKIKNE